MIVERKNLISFLSVIIILSIKTEKAMQAVTTIGKAERNLNIVKELFTAITKGDAETMDKLYHEKAQLQSVKMTPINKNTIIYSHLFFFSLTQNQDVVEPNPRFKTINENTVRVVFNMYILRPKKENTYYTYPIFFTLKDNQIIKEVHSSSLDTMIRRVKTYGIKGLLFSLPFLPYDKQERDKEQYYINRFIEKQEKLRKEEHEDAPIQLRRSKKLGALSKGKMNFSTQN